MIREVPLRPFRASDNTVAGVLMGRGTVRPPSANRRELTAGLSIEKDDSPGLWVGKGIY